jgi:uncharacterized secreted repeat protein (TIGR03808 family)
MQFVRHYLLVVAFSGFGGSSAVCCEWIGFLCMTISRRAALVGGGSAAAMVPGKALAAGADLQAAVNAGGIVDLAAGTFETADLRIERPVTLRGVAGQTFITSASAVMLNVAASDVVIEGVSFSAHSGKTRIISAQDCERLVVSRCSFNGGETAIHLERCSGAISENGFDGQEASGIFSIDARGMQIRGNVVSHVGNNGILVWRSEAGEDGTLVTDNRISMVADRGGGTGQNGNGINVYRAGNVIVANNRISDCAFSGVRNNSASNSQITGNSISRTGECALYVEFAFEGAVVANNVIEDAAFGISLTNFDQGGRMVACTGNIVRNVKGGLAGGNHVAAIGIHAEADCVISGNIVEMAETGIRLGWGGMCRNLSALGNIIRDCKVGIAPSVSEGAGAILIANNMIEGAVVHIQGFDHADARTDDLAAEEAAVPSHVILANNVTR